MLAHLSSLTSLTLIGFTLTDDEQEVILAQVTKLTVVNSINFLELFLNRRGKLDAKKLMTQFFAKQFPSLQEITFIGPLPSRAKNVETEVREQLASQEQVRLLQIYLRSKN